jgi:hypothetical protein
MPVVLAVDPRTIHAFTDEELLIVVATVYDPSDGSGDAGRLGLPPLDAGADVSRRAQLVLAGAGRGASGAGC